MAGAIARRSSGGSGEGGADKRPPSRRRSRTSKPSAEGRSASSRSEAERKQAAAKRAAARKASGRSGPRKPSGKAKAESATAKPAKPSAEESAPSKPSKPSAEKSAAGGERRVPAAPGPARPARLAKPRELWGRRTVAIGVILVGLALVGGIALLIAGGDDNDNGKASQGGVPSELQDKLLQRTVVIPDKGISVRRPANWTSTKKGDVVNVRSHDRCLAMNISAPVPASKANSLRQDGIKVLKSEYDKVVVRAAQGPRVGGIPTTTNAITVTDSKGRQISVLLSVGKGKKYAYLSEIVVRDASCQGDLQLANLMLNAAQFTK